MLRKGVCLVVLYNKYHFTFHDVIKRHERILNRPKDWEIRIVACMFLIVTIINLLTLSVFCSEIENVDINSVSNLRITPSSNFFTSSVSLSVGYFPLEKGYIYHITNNGTTERFLATSSDIPAINVTYNYIGSINPNDSYDYICNNDDYLYFDFSRTESVNITREKIVGYNEAIFGLVDNVGTSQIWGVFENGMSFVGVVVLVAFGLFLVVLAIRRVTKGKGEF